MDHPAAPARFSLLTWWLCILVFVFWGCKKNEPAIFQEDFSRWVDPFIGTGEHGHTYPGATVPFGMVQLSPDTRLEGWDGCSGYHFTDTMLYGFSHTHLSGTGIADYCDVLLMPYTGPARFHNGADGLPGYRSAFDKASEQAEPGYYAVRLLDYPVKAELTATERTGMHRYTFQETDTANILLDLVHRDEVLQSSLRLVSDTEIEGLRISRSWAQEQPVYFVIRFSKPFLNVELDRSVDVDLYQDGLEGRKIKANFRFDVSDGQPLLVKTGLSAVDINGARRNLEAELSGWDFDRVKAETRTQWNRQLSKIAIRTPDEKIKTIFYTALYHASIVPNLFTDVDGRFRGQDKKIHAVPDHTQYTVFSIWDTYRAAHPLYTIIEPERTRDFIRSFLQQYEQTGELPVWELAGNETYCMIGYHSVSVMADAYLKGIRGFDAQLALKAMIATAGQNKFGKEHYRNLGHIPSEKEPESVSKTLEYAYDDWCIAQMAKALGERDVYREFIERAQSFKNVFDPGTGFMRPRNRQMWITPFDPSEVNFHFTEANSWQYSFYVPQDVEGWIGLQGGREQAEKRLDELFSTSSATTGREQADITGLIGQYAHGNEPSHHMAYLYNFTGQPWKTQQMVRRILQELYTDAPDGLSGNEDCGQMSAWYIFSAMGFYPVTPGSNIYLLGSPVVEEAAIPLPNGKTFRVVAHGQSGKSPYIRSVRLNGKKYTRSYLRHEDLQKGGLLEFDMGPEPNKTWGAREEDLPESRIDEHRIVPTPVVSKGSRTFFDADTVELACALPGTSIFYTLDGTDPDPANARKYTGPMVLDRNVSLKAVAVDVRLGKSRILATDFFRIPAKRSIRLATSYAPQYSGGGDYALIDFLEGGTDFRTGEWQGYEGVDLDATIDLGGAQTVSSVAIGFLQDENAWIFMPVRVEFQVSSDGKAYRPAGKIENDIPYKETGVLLKVFETPVNASVRYIRVRGVNRGICPTGHKGAGGKAWIFADEIKIGTQE